MARYYIRLEESTDGTEIMAEGYDWHSVTLGAINKLSRETKLSDNPAFFEENATPPCTKILVFQSRKNRILGDAPQNIICWY